MSFKLSPVVGHDRVLRVSIIDRWLEEEDLPTPKAHLLQAPD